MEKRELAEVVVQQQFFEAVEAPSPEPEEGTREMAPLYPFLISGGTNTERYYFTHINSTTEYKFIIKPEYFGDESNYTEAFPKRIKEILDTNTEAIIFCVFDWDTIRGHQKNLKKHEAFVNLYKSEIENGSVVICPSMPSIEYWFLLHFENYTDLIKTCGTKLQKLLSPFMMSSFPGVKKKLLSLLKSEEYIKDPSWVKNMCADGKLDDAIKRAEENISTAEANKELEKHSYSYVYKVFKK